MSLTLKSFQNEMRNSLAEINARTDQILLTLNVHIKETNSNFREVDQRFEQINQRFEETDQKISKVSSDIAASLMPYLRNIDDMVHDHEHRILALEKQY